MVTAVLSWLQLSTVTTDNTREDKASNYDMNHARHLNPALVNEIYRRNTHFDLVERIC